MKISSDPKFVRTPATIQEERRLERRKFIRDQYAMSFRCLGVVVFALGSFCAIVLMRSA